MSAAARAEARRKAILSRGTDRLSRLTTSARGDDAPQFARAEPPTPPSPSAPKANLSDFIGDDPLPTPPPTSQPPRRTPDLQGSRFRSAGSGGPPSDPSVWPDEQQHQLLRALLGGTPPIGTPLGPDIPGPTEPGAMADDPLMALMSHFATGAGAGKGAGNVPLSQPEARPKSRTQKLLPILHVFSVWALVAFFVFWMEPEAFRAQNSAVVSSSTMWSRWARLATGSLEGSLWSVETVPFFWAFVSLELVLHTMRSFSGFDSVQLPMLLSLALPHLPKPLSSIIVHGLGYMRLAGAILDDLAAAVVAIGLFIVSSYLYQNWSHS